MGTRCFTEFMCMQIAGEGARWAPRPARGSSAGARKGNAPRHLSDTTESGCLWTLLLFPLNVRPFSQIKHNTQNRYTATDNIKETFGSFPGDSEGTRPEQTMGRGHPKVNLAKSHDHTLPPPRGPSRTVTSR